MIRNALAALADLAGRNGDAKGMMLVGKGALNRGYPVRLLRLSCVGHSELPADRS